jgi:hypothetical protein
MQASWSRAQPAGHCPDAMDPDDGNNGESFLLGGEVVHIADVIRVIVSDRLPIVRQLTSAPPRCTL